jgi:hypothetical protein
MKVKCIDRLNSWYALIIGKFYEVIDYNDYDYWIIDENNDSSWHPKRVFKPLSKAEIRNDKIDKLLK